ncbi:MAG: DUF998 domain-containing protein [Candidatus Bathyarchaeia archaeon]
MPHNNSKIAGILLAVGGIQFAVAMIIAEAVYPGYSVSANYISDLGVWSRPSGMIFNPSIILFGLTVLVGSYFVNRQFGNRGITLLLALSGIGPLGVGLFPENTFIVNGVPIFHSIFALIAFIAGGFAAIAFYKITKAPFKYLTVILGVAGLTAMVLFFGTRDYGYLGLGVGGMERMIVYPTLLGIIAFGGYLLGITDEKQPTTP